MYGFSVLLATVNIISNPVILPRLFYICKFILIQKNDKNWCFGHPCGKFKMRKKIRITFDKQVILKLK